MLMGKDMEAIMERETSAADWFLRLLLAAVFVGASLALGYGAGTVDEYVRGMHGLRDAPGPLPARMVAAPERVAWTPALDMLLPACGETLGAVAGGGLMVSFSGSGTVLQWSARGASGPIAFGYDAESGQLSPLTEAARGLLNPAVPCPKERP
jgi:hypothetical protein